MDFRSLVLKIKLMSTATSTVNLKCFSDKIYLSTTMLPYKIAAWVLLPFSVWAHASQVCCSNLKLDKSSNHWQKNPQWGFEFLPTPQLGLAQALTGIHFKCSS